MELINSAINYVKSNTILLNLLVFIFIIILGLLSLSIFRIIYKNIKNKLLNNTTNNYMKLIDDTIKNTLIPVFYIFIFYFAFTFVSTNEKFLKYLKIIFIISITFFGLKFLVSLISFLIEIYFIKKEKDTSKIKNLKGILILFKIIIWSLGLILILDNLGYKITTVLAGLGIGGIAVALAAQSIFGDLFSYFIIIFDKPFEVGDFIIIGDLMGTVETIGLKTTRIRSISGEEIILSNSDLTSSRVKNYKRMQLRRVVFKIGVTYDTPLEKLKNIPAIIKNIIISVKDAKLDRVHFANYGDFSLIFEIVYYVLSNDYNKYMDIQQEINLKIKEEFEKSKIEFAYPTQTLFLKQS